MTKDKKSTFPGSLRDHKDAAKAEAEKVSAKIDEAFLKLAKKCPPSALLRQIECLHERRLAGSS